MKRKEDRLPDGVDEKRRPLAAMARELVNDSATLLRQELTLLRLEIRHNLKDFTRRSGQVAAGGGLALVGLLVLIAFLVVGLGVLLGGAYWLSSLIVALVLLGTGAALAFLGVRRLASTSLIPRTTIATAQDTSKWAGTKVRQLTTGSGGDDGVPADEIGRIALLAPPDGRPPHSAEPASDRSAAPAEAPRPDRKRPFSEPLAKRVFHEIMDDDVFGQAAKVAFFMFTSLPPALLVLFSLTGIFGGQTVGDFVSARLQSLLPGSASDPESAAGFVNQFVEQVVHETAPGPLSIGVILGLWASSAVFVALTEALNRAYDASEARSWVRRRALAIAVMIAFVLFFLGGSLVLIAGPAIANAVQLGGMAELTWSIIQWPLAFLLVVLAFYLVYYVLPNRDQSRRKVALFKGSLIAAALWLLATVGFRLYIANFGSYGETYGFVGAILVLLLWMYLTCIVILVGGEISSELEREARA